MAPYQQLEAWKAAHRMALEMYRVTDRWPGSERYELTTQIRRAAVSVPSNIAEGLARHGSRELRRFLNIARGSLAELSYLLLFARDRGLLDQSQWGELNALGDQVGQLTWGLLRSVSQSVSRSGLADHA